MQFSYCSYTFVDWQEIHNKARQIEKQEKNDFDFAKFKFIIESWKETC